MKIAIIALSLLILVGVSLSARAQVQPVCLVVNGGCASTANPVPTTGGGGGGGAVTLAAGAVAAGAYVAGALVDGAEITMGALADAACATDNGSCSLQALTKRFNQRLTTLITGLGTQTYGAAVAAITTPLSVVEPDDFAVSGTVTSAATLFTQDMQGYSSITVQVTANASGNTILFETSDDNTTWFTTTGLTVGAVGASTAVGSVTAATALVQFQKKGRYFRARVSSFISGTITVAGNLHKNAITNIISSVGIQAGATAIGKVGPGYTSSQTPITASSGNVANGSAAATLAAVSAKTTYITGFQATSDGATVGLCVNLTVAGVITGTMTYTYCAPAGALVSATPLIVAFPQPVPASATNTTIVVTLPALGTGSTNATVVAQGYQE